MLLEGCQPFRTEDSMLYVSRRWWTGLTYRDLVDKAADKYPERTAVVDHATRLTYLQLRETADRLAIALLDLGIKPQQRVLVQLPNWHEFAYTYFALQKIGAIPVLLIDRYRQYEANHLCSLLQASAWVVPEALGKTDYRPIVAEVLKNNPQTRHVIMVRAGEDCPHHRLEDLIAGVSRTENNLARLEASRPDPSDVAHMGPTGGSTGIPKVAPHTHNDLLCNMEYAGAAWELNLHDVLLVVTPIGHDLTFTKGFTSIVSCSGRVVMLDSTTPDSICDAIQKEKVTALPCVPTLASRLVNFERLHEYDLSSLQKMYCAGGKSQPELVKAVREKLGCVFINGYGSTEGMSTMTRSHYDLDRICRTVGRPTCPYDAYRVIDENGRELPPNTKGELVVKGPGVFTGYYKNPEENETAFTSDGFFRSGDLAMIDDRGDIVLCGRLKDIVKRAGENINAAEVETLISGHPDVVLVAVIGMPDREMGERVCAYIQPRDGARLDFAAIISHLKELGASVLQFPERIEFVEAMPLTKVGKLDKRRLREDVEEKLSAQS
ncbi:MAG: AMP-binding protein [Desulfomonile tiedjei]|uniref:AMP-binding protein n=1 Tax=Desulfomonile tiedjei TaxID=2358 RepID=A0A9D6V7R7_9BACT|nr:AMP-binding protein [Desulfomonile tiedjei]